MSLELEESESPTYEKFWWPPAAQGLIRVGQSRTHRSLPDSAVHEITLTLSMLVTKRKQMRQSALRQGHTSAGFLHKFPKNRENVHRDVGTLRPQAKKRSSTETVQDTNYNA